MKEIKPTVLICTPTRALRLYDMLLEQNFDPSDVGLKTLFYIGETCSKAKLDKVSNLWNVSLTTAYGATETNTLALPCHFNRLHLTEDRYHFEVIDPIQEHPINAGERGELVVTSLTSQAMPLLRYRTGDIVMLEKDPCPCGLPFRTIRHYGRFGERVFIETKEVFKYDLEESILSVEGTGCYYGYSVENDHLHIVTEISSDDKQEVIKNIQYNVLEQCGISATVEKIDKDILCQAMDRMLKPGSVSLTHIREVLREQR